MAEFQERYEAAYREATRTCDLYALAEAAYVANRATLGESEWARYQALMAHHQMLHAEEILRTVTESVVGLQARAKFHGSWLAGE